MAQPEKRFKCGGCEAAIFENEINRNGQSITVKKVSIQKRYKATDGSWKSTNSLGSNDVPKMILALSKAYEYLAMREENSQDVAVEELQI